MDAPHHDDHRLGQLVGLFVGDPRQLIERVGDHAVNIAERVTAMGPAPGRSLGAEPR